MTLLLREYSLTIGPEGQDAIQITGLQISFEVGKSLESEGNSCKLQIYNLSDSTRVKLEPVDQVIELKAGYAGQLKTLFIGTTVKTTHLKQGVDLITEVLCKDGNINLREARTNRLFPPGSRVGDILRTLVTEDLGLALGEVVGDGLDRVYQNGLTIDGHTKQNIDTMTTAVDLQWSVQDNVVDIIGKNTSSQETVVLVTPSTGLIGSPQRSDGLQGNLKDKEVPSTGIKFNMLLNGAVRPGRPLKVESESFNGIYKVTKLTHRGDFRGSQWETEIEGDQLSAQ